MITLYIIFKLLFGSAKEDPSPLVDPEEDDYEEMLIMGMIDED